MRGLITDCGKSLRVEQLITFWGIWGADKSIGTYDAGDYSLLGFRLCEGKYNCHEMNFNRNAIATIPAELKGAAKLRVLRLDENTVGANGIPGELLQESSISLISLEGNPVQQRQLQSIEG